jgi:hypothetical protein
MSDNLVNGKPPSGADTPQTPKVVPRNYFECPMNDLVRLVSSMLQELVGLNDALPFTTDQLTRFHSRSSPGISVQEYLIRIIKFCSLEKSILMTMIYFIDLLCTTYAKFNINSLTVHRFMITAAMVGTKGLCDSFCTNSHYARVGGLSKVELNLLEVEFLTRVDYRIVPKVELLDQYYESMVGRLEGTYAFAASPISTSTSTPSHSHRSVKTTLKEAAMSLSKLLPSDVARRENRKNRSSVLKRRPSASVEPEDVSSTQSNNEDTKNELLRTPSTPKRPKATP